MMAVLFAVSWGYGRIHPWIGESTEPGTGSRIGRFTQLNHLSGKVHQRWLVTQFFFFPTQQCCRLMLFTGTRVVLFRQLCFWMKSSGLKRLSKVSCGSWSHLQKNLLGTISKGIKHLFIHFSFYPQWLSISVGCTFHSLGSWSHGVRSQQKWYLECPFTLVTVVVKMALRFRQGWVKNRKSGGSGGLNSGREFWGVDATWHHLKPVWGPVPAAQFQ